MKTLRYEFNSISAKAKSQLRNRPGTLSACSDALKFGKIQISIEVGAGYSPFEAAYIRPELIISVSELVVHVYKQNINSRKKIGKINFLKKIHFWHSVEKVKSNSTKH